MSSRLPVILMLLFLISGCSLFKPAAEQEPAHYYPAPDSAMVHMLDAYRDRLEQFTGEKIAIVKDTLRFGKPEGALGNLVADALRYRAAHETGTFVNIGIIGESSFNLYFEPGDLTLGEVYEFMPYENHLVILSLRGEQVHKLMNQVAEIGGAPVSGVRFNITDGNSARGILVNSEVIDPGRDYLVATSSWAANGGDVFPALWEASERIDLDVKIREIFTDYFRGQAELVDYTDGRIRR